MQYSLVHPDRVEQEWMSVAPWILLSCLPEDLEDIKQLSMEGRYLIWVGQNASQEIDMVLVCGAIGTTVLVNWLGAKNSSCLEDLSKLEAWARDSKFESLQVQGRRGWIRKLRAYGFKLTNGILSKNLLESN